MSQLAEQDTAAPWATKTSLCKFYVSGCTNGSSCRFAHGHHELKQPRWLQANSPRTFYGEDVQSTCKRLHQVLLQQLQQAERHILLAKTSPYAAEQFAAAESILYQAPVFDALTLREHPGVQPKEKQCLNHLVHKSNSLWKTLRGSLAARSASLTAASRPCARNSEHQHCLGRGGHGGRNSAVGGLHSFGEARQQEQIAMQQFLAAQEAVEDEDTDLLSILMDTGSWAPEQLQELLWTAATHGHVSSLKVLVDRADVPGWTQMTRAHSNGTVAPLVFHIIWSPLHWSTKTRVLEVILESDSSTVKCCVSDSPRAHWVGMTPLDMVVLEVAGVPVEVVELLAPKEYPELLERKKVLGDRRLDERVLENIQHQGQDHLWAAHKLLQSLRGHNQGCRRAGQMVQPPQQNDSSSQTVHKADFIDASQELLVTRAARRDFAHMFRGKLGSAEPNQARLKALMAAAKQGSVGNIRSVLSQHPWSRADLSRALHATIVSSVSWPATNEVLQHWTPDWGPWPATLVFKRGTASEHIVFELLVVSTNCFNYPAMLGEVQNILVAMITAWPQVLHIRDGSGYSHPARAAVEAACPLEVIKLLTPYSAHATWKAATGPPGHTTPPLQLALKLSKLRRGDDYAQYYKAVVVHFKALEEQYQLEQKEQNKAALQEMKDVACQLEQAVCQGDEDAIPALFARVSQADWKKHRAKAFPVGGFSVFLEGCVMHAPSLKITNIFVQEARKNEASLQPVEKLVRRLPILQNALIKKNYAHALELLNTCGEAVCSMSRPPLIVALEAGAPLDLISTLSDQCSKHRSKAGGVDELDSANMHLPALFIAVQQGRTDAVEKLLEMSCWWEALANGKLRWTPLCFALSNHQIELAKLLLKHAQKHLVSAGKSKPSLAAYVNTACDGAPPLLRALEMDSGGQLEEELLEAGADPAAFGVTQNDRQKTTALHVAIKQGKTQLVLRMLDVLSGSRLNAVADGKGWLPLHAAVAAKNAEVVKQMMRQGASSVPFSIGSPLVEALRQQQAGSSKALTDILGSMLLGWTADRTALALDASMPRSDQNLVAEFLRSRQHNTLLPFLRDKAQCIKLVQGAVDKQNMPLLDMLLQMPRLNTAGVTLHAAVGKLPASYIKKLIEAGCRANQREVDSSNLPLGGLLVHKAVLAADLEALHMLLELGSDALGVEARDGQGNTLMHWAAMHTPAAKREEVVQALYDLYPPLVRVKNRDGKTPAQYTNNKRTARVLEELSSKAQESHPEVAPAEEVPAGGKRAAEVQEDLTRMGAMNEPESRKRLRIDKMLLKLPHLWVEVQQQAAACLAAAAAEGGPAAGHNGETGEGARDRFQGVVAAAVERTADADPVGADELGGGEDAFSDEGDEKAALEVSHLAASSATMDQLLNSLTSLPWEFTITREAWHEWWGMDINFRRMVLVRLQHIGQGIWARDKKTKRITTPISSLELWSSKLTKGGRIVFEVAADWSETSKCWKEMLRLWVITLDHKRYEVELEKIQNSHRKSRTARERLKLVPQTTSGRPCSAKGHEAAQQRLPQEYEPLGGDEEDGRGGSSGSGTPRSLRMHFPPTSAGEQTYTLLKFYNLSCDLVKAVLSGMAENDVEFPFRVSPAEQDIITMNPQPPRTIILLGRSGTGKTTCAVFRMWARWLTAWQRNQTFHQVFVTASATLQAQVSKSFTRLRMAVVPQEIAEVFAEAGSREYHSMKDVPSEAFPLFLNSRQLLRMLDGTVSEPFFPRRADGSIMWDKSEGDFDPDGMSLRVELDHEAEMEFDEDLEQEGSDDEEEEGVPVRGRAVNKWKRQEVSFPVFAEAMWKDITSKDSRFRVKPGLAWTEIVSYIKGSAEAVRSPTGRLGLEEYLEIGRKRAPNFDQDSRRVVFDIHEAYERIKRLRWRYDNADVVAHVYRQLAAEGYRGVPIQNLYRDEVQDFTQAELLMDLRVVSDPNGLFLCGDTAQTIARGIGFRFTDIQTLFYEERRDQAAKESSGEEAAVAAVQMPDIMQLEVNYRTHSGILDVASSVVDVLKRFFPQHIDPLRRERAFLPGPSPLLLSAVTSDDLAVLLSWSDKSTSQVEFGAHQVVLTRSMESTRRDRLPEALQNVNALFLTVPQSKGLEFDDVFIVNFFSESPAKEEWRVLLEYLEQLEVEQCIKGAAALPTKRPLLDAVKAAEGIGELGRGALRPLPFNPAQHKVLCEELKHLYTAITRAKNSVIIFDDNPTARAPFYYFLSRLGLSKLVLTSLMEEGVDTHELGLTKSRSTPADWAHRGYNLLDNGMFDSAATCFERAGDLARAQYCQIRGKLYQAHLAQEESTGAAKALWFNCAYELLALAINARPDPGLAPTFNSKRNQARGSMSRLEAERRQWVVLAGRAFQSAGEREVAVHIWMELELFNRARQLLLQIGDASRLASCCETAAHVLERKGRPGAAVPWLAEACRQYKAVGQYSKCLNIMESRPDVMRPLRRKHPEMVQEVVVTGMAERHAAKDREGAVRASRLITDHALRCMRLKECGLWEELARVTQDSVEAAEWLAESAGYCAAADRLLSTLAAGCSTAATADRMLRLAHRYVVASGSPQQAQQLWDLLVRASAQGQLAAHVADMQADVAVLVAHHSAGLHPATSMRLPAVEASASACSALKAAKYLASAAGGGPTGEHGDPPVDEELASGSLWTAELATYALAAYQASGNTLAALRCVALLCAVSKALPVHRLLKQGELVVQALQMADGLFNAVMASMSRPAPGRRADPTDVELLAVIEKGFSLRGLSEAGSVAVTCPQHDPRFPAVLEAYRSAAATTHINSLGHSSSAQPAVKGGTGGAATSGTGKHLAIPLNPRKHEGARQPGAAPSMPSTVLSCNGSSARRALAWWLHHMTVAAATTHLQHFSTTRPGATVQPGTLAVIQERVRAVSSALSTFGKVLSFHQMFQRRQLPASGLHRDPQRSYLSAASQQSGGGAGGSDSMVQELLALEGALLSQLAAAVFPTGAVAEVAPTLVRGFLRLLPCPPAHAVEWWKREFLSVSAPQRLGNPDHGFRAWRQLMVLAQEPRRCCQMLKQDASRLRQALKQGSPLRKLLVSVQGSREHAALLLVLAVEKLQQGFVYRACDCMLFYLERCWAVAEVSWADADPNSGGVAALPGLPAPPSPLAAAGGVLSDPEGREGSAAVSGGVQPAEPASGSQGGLDVAHLSPELSCWLLELVTGFAVLACTGRSVPAVYLPQAAAELLQSLPFLDLHKAAASLLSRSQPMERQGLWQRVAFLLASTIQRLGEHGVTGTSGGSGACKEAREDIVGRLAMAAATLLASLAVHCQYGEDKGLPVEVAGALYAAVDAAACAVPALQNPLHLFIKEDKAAGMLLALRGLAQLLGTDVMQLSDKGAGIKCQQFDGLPRSGKMSQFLKMPIIFRAKALKAMRQRVRLPQLAEVQEYVPGNSAEERLARAALVIWNHWSKCCERRRLMEAGRAQREAIKLLKSNLRFRWGVLKWLVNARLNAKRLEQRRRQQQEIDHLRSTVMSGSAEGYILRYSWVEPQLQLGLSFGQACPICPPATQARPGKGPHIAAPGSFNVHATEFLPHLLTQLHQSQLEQFRQYKQQYEAEVAPHLAQTMCVTQELDFVASGDPSAGYHVCRLHSQLLPAWNSTMEILQFVDSCSYEWTTHLNNLKQSAAVLQHCLHQAQVWIQQYKATVTAAVQHAVQGPAVGYGTVSGIFVEPPPEIQFDQGRPAADNVDEQQQGGDQYDDYEEGWVQPRRKRAGKTSTGRPHMLGRHTHHRIVR